MGVVAFHCEVCKCFGPKQVLHRVNEKGEPGVWRCWEHLTQAQRDAIPKEELKLLGIIDEWANKKRQK